MLTALQHPVVKELSSLFGHAHRKLYLVGGSVRDAFLGEFHEDFDFATDAPPEEVIKIVRKWADGMWLVGVKFGTVGVVKNDIKAEITTLRREVYPEPDRHPKVSFSTDIMTDLSRRDFTINAMALELPQGELIDPFGGKDDLRKKLLRTPVTPSQSFLDDPLRMLRAVRFVATLEMHVAPEVKEAMITYRSQLSIVSRERIRDEFSKILMGNKLTSALQLMVDTGLMEEIAPELLTLKMALDPEYDHKDVLEHTFQVVGRVEADLTLRLAALLHDIGKPRCKRIVEDKITFYGHDVVSAHMAERRLKQLKYRGKEVEEVVKLVRMHMRAYTYRQGWTDKAIRKFVRDAGELLPKLLALIKADCTSKDPKRTKEALALLEELENRIKELEAKEESAKIRPPLNGYEVMEFLNISPGPLVGEALNALLEAKLDGIIATKEEAYEFLRKWTSERSEL
ncbi:MAG: CCA tRNA nucleotidyltransferase [Actinomycetota bacterium]|nr:CCA tRNA nucleotidyltransferase [Actinomycetota bacterium]